MEDRLHYKRNNEKITLQFDFKNENLVKLFFHLKDSFDCEINRVEETMTFSIEIIGAVLDSVKNKFEYLFGLEELNESITTVATLKEEIINTSNADYDALSKNEVFVEFKNKIFEMLNINLENEFGDVTKKQLVKVFAFERLKNLINFSEPGAGKTLMSLMRLSSKIKENEKVIIVSPKNSMNVWYDEIKKFSKQSKLIHFMNDEMHKYFSDRKFRKINDFEYADYILINYESLQKLLTEDNLAKLISSGYHVVYDEAHRIKNENSVRNERAKKVGIGAKTRILLTGTPFSRGVADIKEMINIAWSGDNPFISNREFDDYIKSIRINNIKNINSYEKLDSYTKVKIEELNDKIKPLYFLLSKVKDFNILPEIDLHKKPIVVEATKKQMEKDERMMKRISAISFELLTAKTQFEKNKLLEDLNSAITTAQMNATGIAKIEASKKFIISKIKQGEKVLVWAQFVNNIKSLERELSKSGINFKTIYGLTPVEDRQKIIEDVTDDNSSTMVLIANPDTLAESVSLHKHIRNSLFVERRLVYYRWAQSKDRIHRVGSKKQVYHNYIKTSGMLIEDFTFDNLAKKDIIAKRIIGGNNMVKGMFESSNFICDEKDELMQLASSINKKPKQ